MKTNTRLTILPVAAVLGAATLIGPMLDTAHAQRARRNTAIGAGALGAYGLLRGNKTLAIAGGLGSAYAYKRYRDAKKNNRRQTIGQVFGNTRVYDSRRNRYAHNSQFIPNRAYYNVRGQRIG